jgi:hypothetical protein
MYNGQSIERSLDILMSVLQVIDRSPCMCRDPENHDQDPELVPGFICNYCLNWLRMFEDAYDRGVMPINHVTECQHIAVLYCGRKLYEPEFDADYETRNAIDCARLFLTNE